MARVLRVQREPDQRRLFQPVFKAIVPLLRQEAPGAIAGKVDHRRCGQHLPRAQQVEPVCGARVGERKLADRAPAFRAEQPRRRDESLNRPAALLEPVQPERDAAAGFFARQCGEFAFPAGEDFTQIAVVPAGRTRRLVEVHVAMQCQFVAPTQAGIQLAPVTAIIGDRQAVICGHHQVCQRHRGNAANRLDQAFAQLPGRWCDIVDRDAERWRRRRRQRQRQRQQRLRHDCLIA